MLKKVKKYKYLYIIFILGLLINTNLFIEGIPNGHDLSFHLSRIDAISKGLIFGDFPVKIYPDYYDGYGYGNGLFYADIFLYFPAFLVYLGLNTVSAYKILLIFCTIFTGWTMYYCVKEISNSSSAAFLSSCLYMMSSYRLVDIYQRAALGEVLAFIFIPLCIVGIYHLLYGRMKKWFILTIGFSRLFLSHNITTVLIFVLVAIFIIFNLSCFIKNTKRFGYLLLSVITTIGIVCFFLLPMLEQFIYDEFQMVTNANLIGERIVPFTNLFLAFPRFMSEQYIPGGIGFILIVTNLTYIDLWKSNRVICTFHKQIMIIGLITLLLVTDIFPWTELSSLVGFIQFPWRLYIVATALLSISGGIFTIEYSQKYRNSNNIILFFLVWSFIIYGINMIYSYGFSERIYSINEYSTGMAEYLPKNTDIEKIYYRGDTITSNNLLNISSEKKGNSMKIFFNDNNSEDTYLELPLLYYLGYEAILDYEGKIQNLEVTKGDNNVIRINIDDIRSGEIEVKYSGTKIQHMSEIVSLITLTILILYIRKFYKKELV